MPTPSPLRANPFGRRAPWPLAPAGDPAAVTYDNTRECVVNVGEGYWLRPYPTFDRIGPHETAENTTVVLTHQTQHREGNSWLFKLRTVPRGTVGYALLDPEKLTPTEGYTCGWTDASPDFLPTDTTPLRGTSGQTPPGGPPVPAPRPQPAPTSSTGKQVALLVGLAGLGALGVYAWRKSQRGKRR